MQVNNTFGKSKAKFTTWNIVYPNFGDPIYFHQVVNLDCCIVGDKIALKTAKPGLTLGTIKIRVGLWVTPK